MTKTNRARRNAGAALLTTAVAGAGLLSGGAAAAFAAPVNGSCEATAVHLSVLGAAAITANHAGSDTAPCAYDNGVLDVNALGAASATAVEANTNAYGRSATAARSKVANLDIGASAYSGSLTNLLTSGSTSLSGQLDSALAPLIGPGGAVTNAVAPLGGLGLTVAGINSATLLENAKTDLPGAIASDLPHVAGAGLIQADAAATCANGQPSLTGSAHLTDVSVLGTPIDANSTVAKTISLDAQALSVADLVSVNDVLKSITVQVAPASVLSLVVGAGQHSLYDVLTAPSGGLLGTLNAALPVGTTVGSILNGLNGTTQTVISGTEVNLPAGLITAVVTPQSVVNDGTHLTATAISLSVTALGQPVLSGVLAQARVSAGSLDCSVVPPTPTPKPKPTPEPPFFRFGDPTDPSSDPKFPSGFAERALQCDDARLRLLEVRRSGSKTLVQGVAEKQYVGSTATIYLKTGKKKVGTAKVQANGTFSTKVALPSTSIRKTNKARYYAVVSGDKTTSLKFVRRMFVTKLESSSGKVTFSGRMTLPRSNRQKAVKIQERVSCSTYKTVASVKPSKSGKFTVTFKTPAGLSSGVYRAFTQVPTSAPSRKLQPTYTLPRILSFTR